MGAGASAGVEKALSVAKELLGDKLLKGEEEIEVEKAFEGKKAIALYFSAHWCPPCRGFTPKLAEFYKADLQGKGLEIVFISSDRDEAGFKDYYKDMPWLALPFSARDKKAALSKKYKVQGIPALIIINPEDGSLITADGRSAVMKDPKGDKLPWIPPTFKESLGEKFLKVKGDDFEEVGIDAIKGKTLGLYFSAHWCPPCRGFTPKLAEWYAGVKKELGDKFEVIFCSGDNDEAAMKSYFKEQAGNGGDWLCLPFDAKDNLDPHFEIQGIPTFLIVDPDGKVINKGGRSLVSNSATAAEFPWTPPPIADVEAPEGIEETPSLILFLDNCPKEAQKSILDTITPIAAEYAKAAEPELLFFSSTSSGSISAQIRGMCSIESAGQSFKKDSSPDEGGPPKLTRSISSERPTIVLMDIPDNGGFYVGKMAKELDGSGVKQFIQDYKDKKLERKQLSSNN